MREHIKKFLWHEWRFPISPSPEECGEISSALEWWCDSRLYQVYSWAQEWNRCERFCWWCTWNLEKKNKAALVSYESIVVISLTKERQKFQISLLEKKLVCKYRSINHFADCSIEEIRIDINKYVENIHNSSALVKSRIAGARIDSFLNEITSHTLGVHLRCAHSGYIA